MLSPFDREHVVPYFFRNYEVNAIKFCEELTFMEKFKGFNFSIDDMQQIINACWVLLIMNG